MGDTRNKEDSDEVKGLLATIHKLDADRAEARALVRDMFVNMQPSYPTTASELTEERARIALARWDAE